MASEDETAKIDELVNNVREDPALKPEEKECIIRSTKADDEAQVYTGIGSVMRRLLTHPEFRLQDLRDLNGHRLSPEEYTGETVTGVWGRIPVGCRKVRASSRSTSHHADIVSRASGRDEDSTTVSAQEHQVNEEGEADDD